MTTKLQDTQPKNQIPMDQVLQMAWAKVGQLIFQIDILTQQMQALEAENKQLKDGKK